MNVLPRPSPQGDGAEETAEAAQEVILKPKAGPKAVTRGTKISVELSPNAFSSLQKI